MEMAAWAVVNWTEKPERYLGDEKSFSNLGALLIGVASENANLVRSVVRPHEIEIQL